MVSLAVFATTLTHALVAPKAEEEMSVSVAHQPLEASTTDPVRLIIPSIGVDAKVQHVGISKQGTMAVPTNYTDVGWYKFGSVPGELGSAVIAGHLDNGFGLSGVFRKLGELQIGDEIIVQDKAGTRSHFRVTKTEVLGSGIQDTEEIFAMSDSARLNLITCEGDWIPEKESYGSRRVVFTTFTYAEQGEQ
ncbi:MAG: peptidase sortase [Candidatus Paceibacter sp.]|nr:peptidase sortase [Candidatus Paceibacter sp.]